MKKRWFWMLMLLILTLSACPSIPESLGAQWDSSNFDQAIWQ